jgi:hypothetical protein
MKTALRFENVSKPARPVVFAHAARADAAERQVLLGDVEDRLVHRDAARRGFREDPVDGVRIVVEDVERQRTRARVHEGDRLVEVR